MSLFGSLADVAIVDLLQFVHLSGRSGTLYLERDDEILLLKTFDSATDGRARYMPHTAFTDPATVPGTEKRQSIESRVLVFW